MVTKRTRRTLVPRRSFEAQQRDRERALAPPTKKKFSGKTFDLGAMVTTKAMADAKVKSFNARGFEARIARIKPFTSRGKVVNFGIWIS